MTLQSREIQPYQLFSPFQKPVSRVYFDPKEIPLDDQGQPDENYYNLLDIAHPRIKFQGIEVGMRLFVRPEDVVEIARKAEKLHERVDVSELILKGIFRAEDLPVYLQLRYYSDSPTLVGRAQYYLAEINTPANQIYLDTRDDLDIRQHAFDRDPSQRHSDFGGRLSSVNYYDEVGQTARLDLSYNPAHLSLLQARFVNIPLDFDPAGGKNFQFRPAY